MENVSPNNPHRILVRGVNWLGDAVMTTPALLRLREKFPDAHIALLTPEKLRDLWLNHPAVNETISFGVGETIFAVGKRLRAAKFDVALVLPNSPRSAIEVFLAGIPRRLGYARPWRNFFLTQTIAPRAGAVKMRKRSVAEIQRLISRAPASKSDLPKTAHQNHEYLHLVAELGANPEPLAPQLFVTTDEIQAVKTKFGLEKISKPILGLNAGAEYGPAKRWPTDRFISAAKEIQQQTDCTWILFGGKNDLEITRQIASEAQNQKLNVQNLVGKTSLRELMAALKICNALLTNDTGPMHLAAALGVSIVAIFGSTSPELTGPIFSNGTRILKSDAPCSPCFLRECPIDFRCMKGIAVEQVVAEVLKVTSQD
ncbi:MAG TPA: lipopolysaccharide heptosyltransferase II [Verrucomicrobiae bacterium]|jgi:lipopolysaccharide heptosyltransferase II